MFAPKINLKRIISASVLFMACAANAQSDDRKYLIKLVESGMYQDAFELADSLFEQYAGDADFDYLYALAARQIGKHQEAIFAFERVVINRPNNLNARYALAVAYYEVDNFAASKREFNNLVKLKPSAKITEQAERYLQLIDKQSVKLDPVWSGFAGLSLGHDSNVSSGLGDEKYPISILGLSLPGEGIPFPIESDQFYRVNANLAYRYPTAKYNAWFASATASHTDYQSFGQYNKSNIDVMAGYTHRIGALQLRTSVFAQGFWYGEEKYHNLAAVMASANFAFDDSASVQITGNYTNIDNDKNDNLDTTSALVRIEYLKQLDSARLSLGTSFRDENVKNFNLQSQQYERTVSGISANWQQKLQSWGILRLTWQYQQANHQHLNETLTQSDGTTVLFDEKRKDHNIIYQLGFDYVISANWLWQTQARLSRKNSNQFLYSFDRNVVNSGIRYLF